MLTRGVSVILRTPQRTRNVFPLGELRLAAAAFTSSAIACTTAKRPAQRRKGEEKINYNAELSFRDVPDPEHVSFRRVTANDLEHLRAPPTRVKMLVRDFIEDSLYNPHYGYFPKQVTIFTSHEEPINFNRMHDGAEFQEEVAARYQAYGKDADEGPGRQIWHTPTELFQVCSCL
jgi:hypothetical protein